MNKFQTIWKQLAAKRNLSSSDMVVWAISKAVHEEQRLKKLNIESQLTALDLARQYLKKSFKPISKPIKLANGAYPYYALDAALWNLTRCESYKAFDSLWDEETRNKIKEIAIEIRGKQYGSVNL